MPMIATIYAWITSYLPSSNDHNTPNNANNKERNAPKTPKDLVPYDRTEEEERRPPYPLGGETAMSASVEVLVLEAKKVDVEGGWGG